MELSNKFPTKVDEQLNFIEMVGIQMNRSLLLYSQDTNQDQMYNDLIQNIELLYPVEFQKPGLVLIEFSNTEIRNKTNQLFTVIQTVINNEIKNNRMST